MRDLAEQIGRLEAEVRASHQQLQVLSQSVFSARAPGARAHISFTNDLSDAYRLQRALIVLDGAVQVRRRDSTGKLAARRQIPIFSGRISPGKHRLRVVLRLRGHGTGRFAYLSGQKFEVKSIHSFEVREGSSIDLTVNLWEMVGSGASLDQRPAVRYIETVQSGPRGRGLTGSSVGQTPAATGRGRRD
jgi:hypothetical protein